jgi:hypothetical protein
VEERRKRGEWERRGERRGRKRRERGEEERGRGERGEREERERERERERESTFVINETKDSWTALSSNFPRKVILLDAACNISITFNLACSFLAREASCVDIRKMNKH